MKTEAATILIIVLGSLILFFLVLPMAVIFANLRGVWHANRPVGLVLSVVFGLTAVLFLLYFFALGSLTFSGAPGK